MYIVIIFPNNFYNSIFLKTRLLLKTMETLIFDKNFLDHPEQQKRQKIQTSH